MMHYKRLSATLRGCKPEALWDLKFLEEAVREAARAAGMEIVPIFGNPLVYKADPSNDPMGGGVTVLALITRSHIAIHSSIEGECIMFNCETCGEGTDPDAALKAFADLCGADVVDIHYTDYAGIDP
jgi:S-adenosylmethionine/arginine decarboxylase-like enzyme